MSPSKTIYLLPPPFSDKQTEALLSHLSADSALLKLSPGDDVSGLVQQNWGERAFAHVEIIKINAAYKEHKAYYDAAAESLQTMFAREWANALTLINLGRRYALNFIKNLGLGLRWSALPRWSSLSRPQDLGSLSWGDATVLVCGAGPSLDVFLKDFKRQANEKIICVDTAIGALQARGIQPDLVLALECQHWNLRDFVGVGKDLPIAMDMSALPQTAEFAGGGDEERSSLYLFFTPWTRLRIFDRLGEAGFLPVAFPPMGSVGVCALYAAQCLSTGPIRTAGLDFAYSLDAYHAKGTPGSKDLYRKTTRLKSLYNAAAAYRPGSEAIKGSQSRTDPGMRAYRNLFQELTRRRRGAEGFDMITNNNPASSASPREIFIIESNRVKKLKNILTGENPDTSQLDTLLDECDYLYAHFPECAARIGPDGFILRPPASDLSFLNRVRAELEFFDKAWGQVLA